MKSSLLGVPIGTPEILFGVAAAIIAKVTSAGVYDGYDCKILAATPATCGDAIDVPDMIAVGLFAEIPAEVIETPGAITSTHFPRLLKLAKVSVRSLAATVIAFGTRAGEDLHASCFEFPAATTTVTPSAMRLLTAVSNAKDAPPPKLMFATAGLVW